MKRRSETLSLLAMVCSALTMLFAFTTTYRIDTPAGTDDPSEGDDRIREVKRATQERLDVDHYWTQSSANTYDDPNTGKHRWVTFKEPNNITVVPTGEGVLFTKDVNGVPELHWIDQDENLLQLTVEGKLRMQSSYLVEALDNDVWFAARNAADDGWINLIKADTGDKPVLGDGASLATTADPNEPTDLIHLKYLGDRLAAYVMVSDQKIDAHGGSSSGSAWDTRDLNTEDSDAYNLCSLAANRITLKAGTYRCHITTNVVLNAQQGTYTTGAARLYHVNTATTLLWSPPAFFYSPTYGDKYPGVNHVIVGQFTIADYQSLEVQTRTGTAQANWGLGYRAWTDTTPNVYTIAEFWKID